MLCRFSVLCRLSHVHDVILYMRRLRGGPGIRRRLSGDPCGPRQDAGDSGVAPIGPRAGSAGVFGAGELPGTSDPSLGALRSSSPCSGVPSSSTATCLDASRRRSFACRGKCGGGCGFAGVVRLGPEGSDHSRDRRDRLYSFVAVRCCG